MQNAVVYRVVHGKDAVQSHTRASTEGSSRELGYAHYCIRLSQNPVAHLVAQRALVRIIRRVRMNQECGPSQPSEYQAESSIAWTLGDMDHIDVLSPTP